MTRAEPVEGSSNENEADLKKRLEVAQDEDQRMIDHLQMLEARQNALRAFLDVTSVQLAHAFAQGQAEIERIRVVIEFTEGELKTLGEERRALNQARKPIQHEIETLQAALKTLRGPGKVRRWWVAQISVEATQSTSMTVSLSYLVSDASWEPAYDLRLRGNTLTVTYLALVRQSTGEDWPSLPLSLSTAASHQAPTLTLPSPWRLDGLSADTRRRLEQEHLAATRVDPDRLLPLHSVSSGPFQAPDSVASPTRETPQIEVVPAGPAVMYRTPREFSILSDNIPRKTRLAIFELNAPLDYASVPKVSSQAVLRTKVQNTSALTLIPGEATLFQDDTYVGQTRIGTVAPGEEFALILGGEDRIRIRRDRIEHKVSVVGEPSLRQISHTYRIRVDNHLDEEALVTVRDQLPTSIHGAIRVSLTQVVPEPVSHREGELDILKWRLRIPAQASETITFTFEVTYPPDLEITGIV